MRSIVRVVASWLVTWAIIYASGQIVPRLSASPAGAAVTAAFITGGVTYGAVLRKRRQ